MENKRKISGNKEKRRKKEKKKRMLGKITEIKEKLTLKFW